MNVIVAWHNQEKSIIRITLNQGWTWHEIYQIDEQIDAMLNTVEHQVSYIVDVRKGYRYAADFSLSLVQKTMNLHHPNSDRMIVVGPNMFMRLLLTNVFKVMQAGSTKVQIADTIEEAEMLLTTRTYTGLTQQLQPSGQVSGLR